MGDRLIRGALAGLLGQLGIMAVNLPSKFLFHFSSHLWAEYGSVLVFGHPPKGLPETGVAYLAIFIFAGTVGAGFSMLMTLFPDRPAYLLRGLGWAYAVWLWTFIIGNIYKMPLYDAMDWRTSLTQFVAITVYGLIVATLTSVWDRACSCPEAPLAREGAQPKVSSGEFGTIANKLDAIADRLSLIVERAGGLPGRSEPGGPAEEDTESEDGWERVEHLGFRRLQPDEGPDVK